MNYSHSFKFRINKQRLGADGKGSIYLIVRINGEAASPIKMDLRWFPERFNPLTGACNPGTKSKEAVSEASDITLNLGKELSKARKVVLLARLEDRPFDLKTFLENFNNFAARTDFVTFARTEIRWRSQHDQKSFSENTERSHRESIDRLEKYARHKGGTEVRFNSFNSQWCAEFESFLRDHEQLKPGSVWRYLKDVRTYLNRARAKHQISFYYPFKDFELVSPEANVNDQENQVLTTGEETILWSYYLKCEPKSAHRRVLQAAFASLDAGFRISDLERLKKNQIDFLAKRVKFIPHKQRRPTKKRPNPPELNNMLTDRAMMVMRDSIRENSSKISRKSAECIFDLMVSSKGNFYLKEIMKKVGIKKRVSWHVFRHTCATKLSNAGMQEFQLMDFFAWTDVETARRYVKKRSETLDDIVSRLNGQEWILGTSSKAS